MFIYYFSLALAVLGLILYHIAQKSIAPNAHPIISVLATYAAAFVATLFLLPFFPAKEGIIAAIKNLNWASYGAGIVVVAAEIGFLLAYRSGWNISLLNIISNLLVTLVLLPLGLFLFREKLNAYQIIGLILAVLSFVLLNKK